MKLASKKGSHISPPAFLRLSVLFLPSRATTNESNLSCIGCAHFPSYKPRQVPTVTGPDCRRSNIRAALNLSRSDIAFDPERRSRIYQRCSFLLPDSRCSAESYCPFAAKLSLRPCDPKSNCQSVCPDTKNFLVFWSGNKNSYAWRDSYVVLSPIFLFGTF